MSGKIDFSGYQPQDLIDRAVIYQKQLSAYFHRAVSDNYIEAEFPLYSGEILAYDGFIDYTHPTLRRIIKEGTLPRAKDLLDTARQKGCEQSLTKIFGEYLVHVIEKQTTDPVLEHSCRLRENQSVQIKGERLWLFCQRAHS